MSECEACATAAEVGWWADSIPEGWTHSRDTHVSFPGTDIWGECTGCGNIFHGVQAFDYHHEARVCSRLQELQHSAATDVASLSGGPPGVLEWTYGGQTYTRRLHERGGFWFYQEDTERRKKLEE